MIEDQEYERSLWTKIMGCSEDELSVYLTSSDPLERFIAEQRIKDNESRTVCVDHDV